ncbi:SGNH/GDSL hydrolase family protein [Corynebacterium variabile]|uniref:SGNH/GDSL hydrolase family protein n=1 Tax=Corynebacterium variabile TaxID=1727 RepID=UPI002FDFC58B
MAINIGNLPLVSAYVGSTEIKSIYVGSTLVWENKTRTTVDYKWSEAQTSPYRVMFLGSSTTYGHAVAWTEGFANQMVAHIVSDQIPVPATPIQRSTSSRSAPTAAGFHFHNAGVGGTTSINYCGTDQKNLTAAYRPRLVIHMVGSNDYANGTAPTTYRSYIERSIGEINNRSAGCRHLLVHQFQREDVTNPAYPWTDYRDQLRSIAASRDDTDFCDANRILTEEIGWDSSYLQSDRVHANWFGNTLLARAVRNFLKLNDHEGELIYGLDASDLTYSAGQRVTNWPAIAGSLINLPATEGSNNSPIMRRNNPSIPFVDFYNGALRLKTTSWPGAVAAPMTMFMVTNRFNDGYGNDMKPIFTRNYVSDDGYLWAWRQTNENKIKAALSSTTSPGVVVDRGKIDYDMVMAITFHPNGWGSLYVNSTSGTDMAPTGSDTAYGPWLKSFKLMTNTAENVHGEANVRYFSLVKGTEVADTMRSLGARFGITIKEQA